MKHVETPDRAVAASGADPSLRAGRAAVHHSGQRYPFPEEDELWGWDYESLGYILNEIFARHGYNFIAGGKYDNYFSALAWYAPNADPDNSAACYSQLTSLEWANEHLVKQVRSDMRAQDTANPSGKHYLDYISFDHFDILSGFTYVALKTGQKLAVYSAPGTSSWRGAKGKAAVSTNGSVYAAGWDGNWLLVMYETNNGAVRVGYVNGSDIKGGAQSGNLRFITQPATCIRSANLTDDPVATLTTIRTLQAGETVTYLSAFQSGSASWAYVQTTVDGKTARGFIPYDALNLGGLTDENDE
jgi:hypothetical protein